ncbi:hypothetical protein CSC34_3876 [Pseudomonas aeruginosa]|nr:hypothetical protein CSC34_3876 [Pseudomonas aeruginosa]
MSVWLVALKEEVIGSISKPTSVANGVSLVPEVLIRCRALAL